MKKNYLLITFFILLVGAGIFFYIKNTNLPPKPSGENLPKTEENLAEKKQENESKNSQLNFSELDRQEIMNNIAKRIGDISPIEPVLGGSWYPIRFWFVKNSNENFYVEYEDGHILGRILLKAEKKEDKLNYKIIGYFEPGESGWILKSGKDPYFNKSLDLYEYYEELGLWAKKN